MATIVFYVLPVIGDLRWLNMRSKKTLIAIISTTLFATVTTIGVTVAWLSPATNISNMNHPIEGVVQDKYYESGDGLTPETAFLITRPRHLYNLAWLQYLGFYNKNEGVDNHQFYFKLGDNIDMSKFGAIPPIGTELNPFVGNFDGQGFIISGVTVSNNFSDYESHPSAINGWDNSTKKQPHILGLFGIVGDYTNGNKPTNYNSAINQFVNTGITGATIKTVVPDSLMGVAAGYVSGNMSNILVDVSTVDVDSSIAGETSSYGGFTQNISDYTLVGYTENVASVKKAEQSIYGIDVTSNLTFNAQDEGDNEGWGGSINMKTIYYRLYAFKKNKVSNVESTFQWKENHYYYNGVENVNEATGTTGVTAASADGSNTPHLQRFVGSQQSGHEFIGNYNYFHRRDTLINSTDYSTTDQSYLYLCGGHYENRTYRTLNTTTGYPITDGNGHYFSVLTFTSGSSSTAGTLGNTNQANSTLWSVPTSGSGYISTTYHFNGGNPVTYYLYVNGSNELILSAMQNYRTQFTYAKDANTGKIRYSTSSGYYLCFDGSSWGLAPLINSFQISYNGTYLSRNTSGTIASDIATSLSYTNTPGWRFENSSGTAVTSLGNTTSNVYICTIYNGTKYYLYDENLSSNYYKVGLTSDTSKRDSYTITKSNNTYTVYDGSYYLVYDAKNSLFSIWNESTNNQRYGKLTIQTSASLASNFTDSYCIYDSQSTTKDGPHYYQTSTDTSLTTNNSRMYYTAEDTTYFPLNVEKDISEPITSANTVNTAINNGDLDPKDSNTGYIISGSDLANQSTYTSARSSIRISEYALANINASFNVQPNANSTISDFPDSTVYTINTSGAERNMSQLDLTSENTVYPRYNETKPSFYKNSLTTTTTQGNTSTTKANPCVYGLHFMTSKISTESVVNGAKVSILGNKCDNYQLPVNCIDFNLKQKGVINFFAGTYYTDNDSFFSLYQIIRNNDAVTKTDGSGDPISGEYTSYNTISEIREIVAVYSNDRGTKTSKYSNIYKYKKIVNGNTVYTYSEPYRFDGNQNKYKMNLNNTADSSIPYVENLEMSESDFNSYVSTYGYTQRLDSAAQLGKQNSAYTTNRIYYFEFPMNSGEYCLGSVDGGTGAYLLYLDIGANAAKTQRTIFYEHFTIDEKTYSYPTGVSLKDLGDPTTYGERIAVINVAQVVDPSDSACMKITATAKGEFTIDRNGNNVALTRAQTNKAPPVYSSDTIESLYESSTLQDVEVEHIATHTYDIRRMEFFDYNVNLEYLTVTTFIDAADEGEGYTRTYVSQTVYSGATTSSDVVARYTYFPGGDPATDQRSLMKIYNTSNGIKFDSDDIANVATIVIDPNMMSDDVIMTFRLFQDNGNIYEDATSVLAHVDSGNISGTYYVADYYVMSFIPTSGSTITIKIVSLTTGETIYYETTLITGAGQVITEGPQP